MIVLLISMLVVAEGDLTYVEMCSKEDSSFFVSQLSSRRWL